MNSMSRLAFASLMFGSVSAQAADSWVTAALSHTDYTGDYGERDILSAEYGHSFDDNTLVLKVLGGSREYDSGASFDDSGLSGTFYRNWNDKFSTRTNVAISEDEPVFANRVFDQEFSYKAFRNTVLTVGAKHTEYSDGVDSNAWYTAAAYYFDRVMIRYRYTQYNLSGIDDSYGNLLTVRLKDRTGAGSTQLWLGQGTSVQEYDWSPVVQNGDYKSVALRRVQPLSQKVTLNFGVSQAWYETAVADYKGLTSNLGLTYRW